jgi:hypothetical protein
MKVRYITLIFLLIYGLFAAYGVSGADLDSGAPDTKGCPPNWTTTEILPDGSIIATYTGGARCEKDPGGNITETKPNGSVIKTATEKDGNIIENNTGRSRLKKTDKTTETTTERDSDGNIIKRIETTIETDPDGNTIETRVETDQDGSTSVTTIKKDSYGNIIGDGALNSPQPDTVPTSKSGSFTLPVNSDLSKFTNSKIAAIFDQWGS